MNIDLSTIMAMALSAMIAAMGYMTLRITSKITEARLEHDKRMYEQREKLLALLTEEEEGRVDESIQQWLAYRLVGVDEEVRKAVEAAYRDAVRSIVDDSTKH